MLRTIDDSLTVTIQELYAYEHSATDERPTRMKLAGCRAI